MMAVYAASGETLVLRSVESPGSRYHQRAWTVQEYCCAKHLRVITQEQGSSSRGVGGAYAVDKEEEEVFPAFREWHRARGNSCRPYWLYGLASFSASEVKDIVARLNVISGRVLCQVPADRIRALYPMLFNTPIEDQQELVELVSKALELSEALDDRDNPANAVLKQDKALIESLRVPPASVHLGWVHGFGAELGNLRTGEQAMTGQP